VHKLDKTQPGALPAVIQRDAALPAPADAQKNGNAGNCQGAQNFKQSPVCIYYNMRISKINGFFAFLRGLRRKMIEKHIFWKK